MKSTIPFLLSAAILGGASWLLVKSKTMPAISNRVPAPLPPVSAAK